MARWDPVVAYFKSADFQQFLNNILKKSYIFSNPKANPKGE